MGTSPRDPQPRVRLCIEHERKGVEQHIQSFLRFIESAEIEYERLFMSGQTEQMVGHTG